VTIDDPETLLMFERRCDPFFWGYAARPQASSGRDSDKSLSQVCPGQRRQGSIMKTFVHIDSTHARSPHKRGTRTRIASLLAVAVLFSSIAGCVTDPYTGERRISKTAMGGVFGAGIGAGVAAGIAALAGKDAAKAALIGAGVGALGGASVGGYMDYQDAKLRRFLEGTGVRVVRVGNEITLSMPSNITFATDSATLSPDFLNIMHSVALVLIEYDKTIIEVMGHTDSTGSEAYNLDLSKRRAAAVGNHLIGERINPMRILTDGFGEAYPVASNDTVGGRELNRRVELRLSPLTQP
jgi:outer membrane protein OmpA-like peptidoglycan-associated protein